MDGFGSRLRSAMDERGALCVGIDPHASLLAEWGLPDTPEGLERFTMTAVEAMAPDIAVLKPQSAFFERHGSRGIAVLEKAVGEARRAGALVLLDVKRGDIGSTMQGYADAYLDQSSPLAVDAITVSPYLGFESLRPALSTATAHGAGVFVLGLTSNPEGVQVQHARNGDRLVAQEILDAIRAENVGHGPMGPIGAVVGANLASLAADVAVGGPLLAPGFGAQGGTLDDVRRLFADVLPYVVPTSSRDVLRHGPDLVPLRDAARRTRDAVAALTSS